MRTASALIALVFIAACDAPEGPNTTASGTPTTAPPAAATAASGTRTISESARAAMKDALSAEASGKKVWILSQPGNPEVTALVGSLSSVFKEAGWEVSSETASGISLKPGIMTLMGDETYPSYVDTALKALDAAGLDAKSASGYRGYYEAKKRENPNWPGVPMRPDQDFIIVVGPKPAA